MGGPRERKRVFFSLSVLIEVEGRWGLQVASTAGCPGEVAQRSLDESRPILYCVGAVVRLEICQEEGRGACRADGLDLVFVHEARRVRKDCGELEGSGFQCVRSPVLGAARTSAGGVSSWGQTTSLVLPQRSWMGAAEPGSAGITARPSLC